MFQELTSHLWPIMPALARVGCRAILGHGKLQWTVLGQNTPSSDGARGRTLTAHFHAALFKGVLIADIRGVTGDDDRPFRGNVPGMPQALTRTNQTQSFHSP